MIYLVTRIQKLFKSDKYEIVDIHKALSILEPLKRVQADTETLGLDCWTKALLTLQLGNKENQVVFDWTTMSKEEKLLIKAYMESSRVFIFHNAQFDLTFLYHEDIWPKKILDTMIIEQVIYLGYPSKIKKSEWDEKEFNFPFYEYEPNKDLKRDGVYKLSYSLNKVALRRIGIEIDKTVRGAIINEGLTERVVVYAANDVVYLEDILESQIKDLEREDLLTAAQFECESVKFLAYVKYCGVHLDANLWSEKMRKDKIRLNNAVTALNDWVVNWEKENVFSKNGHRWLVTYADKECPEYSKIKKRLIDLGFFALASKDRGSLEAYIIEYKHSFTKIDLQGDLFLGFNTDPQCTINWSSSMQVIALFELLGIGVKTFDKETRKEKKSVENKQMESQKQFFSILPLFLEYQKADKIASTYGQNWLNAINPVSGRIHVELHCLGTATARVASGGGPYKLNQQNIPHDAETRACFTAEKGNVWLSCDYTGQESAITASVSQDPVMMEILKTGGDLHSEVAKASWPELLGGKTVKEIKAQYKAYRQDAKGIEFAVFYGGDDNTIKQNKGFSAEEAKRIYDGFMSRFRGIRDYQAYCRKVFLKDGYILMNPVTRHKSHIKDIEFIYKIRSLTKREGFWEDYSYAKKYDPTSDLVQSYRRYRKCISEWEKDSINYRIQNRGAGCFKLAMIKYFNWIVEHKYQNIVKIAAIVHDECNVECPECLSKEAGSKLVECMVAGGKPYCPNVYLGADLEVGNCWIH